MSAPSFIKVMNLAIRILQSCERKGRKDRKNGSNDRTLRTFSMRAVNSIELKIQVTLVFGCTDKLNGAHWREM